MSAKSNVDIESKLKGREGRRTSFVASVADKEVAENHQEPAKIVENDKTNNKDINKQSKIIRRIENKSRKKTILLQPSVHDEAAELCKEINVSMNEVINQLLKKWIEEEKN